MTGVPEPLRAALRRVATVPTLLVGVDYDGVLAPIVDDPGQAVPLPAGADAVRAVAALPATEAVLLSGRALGDLAALSGLAGAVRMVGSHGAEFDVGFAAAIPADAVELRARLLATLTGMVAAVPGARLEVKPASVAVHVRTAAPDAGERLLADIAAGPARWDGVHPTAGKKVLELAVVQTSKGTALQALRDELRADAVVFVGDDVTDEAAFAVLGEGDVGVKVGPGDTAAAYRVDDPTSAAAMLALLAEERRHG